MNTPLSPGVLKSSISETESQDSLVVYFPLFFLINTTEIQ